MINNIAIYIYIYICIYNLLFLHLNLNNKKKRPIAQPLFVFQTFLYAPNIACHEPTNLGTPICFFNDFMGFL